MGFRPTGTAAGTGYPVFLVKTQIPDPAETADAIEKMRQETDALLEQTARLIKEADELLETSRQHRAANAALMEERRKNKKAK